MNLELYNMLKTSAEADRALISLVDADDRLNTLKIYFDQKSLIK